ncbi:GNAT family N-acetyltransferase [Sphingomonas radiodurans]|uniref:GNAT family N-acetyltransferase n=1 Tax=Sphingomonas radiodurans TaxID=2890321 RepID=UPI001E2C8154|nr:GNAT family N-acetyltransferase [Sphingomonas radiodurans]WBH17395.1 GNAT family N-acetyltransferase [Sphingomonas radiodurans]
MTVPLPLDSFARLPRLLRATLVEGLSTGIDRIAEAAAPTHAFLRQQWFAAAVAAYGGPARTLTVHAEDHPVLALPIVPVGPAIFGMATVPGCYWPFRSFPLAGDAGSEVLEAALDTLARHVRALRVGPVYDGDAAVAPLVDAARSRGWAVLSRPVAASFLLDMAAAQAEGTWPRNSTLRKNRFHEKHLGEHGALDWRFLSGADWPAAFDDLAAVEQASWVASDTDGSDAKFTTAGHGAFWRAAAADPVLAAMFRAALLTVDGKPAAFSFDMDTGTLKYAIANSYDPAFGKHSPGKLLYYRNLVDALGRGITQVDWGAGDSGYKRTIGAAEGPAIRDWLLLRPGWPAALAPLVRRVWQAR